MNYGGMSWKHTLELMFNKLSYSPVLTKLENWIFDEEFGKDELLDHFKSKNLKGYGLEMYTAGISTAGALYSLGTVAGT